MSLKHKTQIMGIRFWKWWFKLHEATIIHAKVNDRIILLEKVSNFVKSKPEYNNENYYPISVPYGNPNNSEELVKLLYSINANISNLNDIRERKELQSSLNTTLEASKPWFIWLTVSRGNVYEPMAQIESLVDTMIKTLKTIHGLETHQIDTMVETHLNKVIDIIDSVIPHILRSFK